MADELLSLCFRALAWAEEQDYCGYGKFDALNSQWLHRITGDSRILRGGAVYLVSRAPLNLRPFLKVEKRHSPKGLALFARSYMNLHRLDEDGEWLGKALSLLRRLLPLSQIGQFSGHCWGAEYPRQSTKFFIESYYPTAVVTVEVGEAFLDAFQLTGEKWLLDVAHSTALFLTEDLDAIDYGTDELLYSYIPGNKLQVINSNAKIGSYLARLGMIAEDVSLATKAHAVMNWVVNRQTSNGAWYYAHPPEASHVKHDNYHTGFVLNSLREYMLAAQDFEWKGAYQRGLQYYQSHLFQPNGRPKWRSDRVYPLDIHGAAQGILVFSSCAERYPAYMEMAERILKWVTADMMAPEGRFYYQKGRLLTKKYTLMRWCQAWMSYALSVMAISSGGRQLDYLSAA